MLIVGKGATVTGDPSRDDWNLLGVLPTLLIRRFGLVLVLYNRLPSKQSIFGRIFSRHPVDLPRRQHPKYLGLLRRQEALVCQWYSGTLRKQCYFKSSFFLRTMKHSGTKALVVSTSLKFSAILAFAAVEAAKTKQQTNLA